jgi:ABC-2 type transport system permease protein
MEISKIDVSRGWGLFGRGWNAFKGDPVTWILMLIIFMSVFGYGVYVMRGVLEEKSSHIVEVVISTVRPFELMLGKILGIGAVGLTQMLVWSGLALGVTAPGAAVAVGLGAIEMPAIPLSLMVYFVIYFVLGFLLYGTFYAGVGAAFSTEQEAQNFQGVLMLFFMAPLMLMMLVLNDPDGAASVVLSLIPIFTPTLMFLRLTLIKVPMIQVLASILLLVLSIGVSAWVVGKIYRVGILMHGSKPKLKDLLRWVREA